MKDAEIRLVEDSARLDALRGRDARELPAQHMRLLKVSTSNERTSDEAEPFRVVGSVLRNTLSDELASLRQNVATPVRRNVPCQDRKQSKGDVQHR
jgi:hypothetical protein